MLDLTFEQISLLIDQAGRKSLFDYIALLGQTIIPLAAMALSYKSIKSHARNIATEKVLEKEINRLYQSADCFFEYSDKANLYFSLSIRKITTKDIAKDEITSFEKKLQDASDAMYESITAIKKSIFMLNSLEESELAKKIDKFREESIKLRKKILDSNDSQKNSPANKAQFLSIITNEKEKLYQLREEILSEVSQANKRLKRKLEID